MTSYLSKDSIELYKAVSDSNETRLMESWHASSIAECPRAQYLKRYLGPKLAETVDEISETKPSGAKILRWEAGHAFEAAIREHLPAIFPEGEHITSNERMWSMGHDLTGEYDNYAHESKTLVEIKTVHDYAFIERNGKVTLKERIPDEYDEEGNLIKQKAKYRAMEGPYLHHAMQNHAYAILLKANKNIDVERIKYVYISLSGRMVTYDTPVDPKLLQKVEHRLELLNNAWEAQEAPECLCNEQHPLWGPVMQWCDFRTDTGCCLIDKE